CQLQTVLAAPEAFRDTAGNERPGDGLHQSAPRQYAARAANATLQLRQHGSRNTTESRHGSGWHLVETGDSDDLLDKIGGAVDVGTPARRGHLRRDSSA